MLHNFTIITYMDPLDSLQRPLEIHGPPVKSLCSRSGVGNLFCLQAVLKKILALRATTYEQTILDSYILRSYLPAKYTKTTPRAG